MVTYQDQPGTETLTLEESLQSRRITTRKQRQVTVREVQPGDNQLLVRMLSRLSAHTQWLRFFRLYTRSETIWQDAVAFAHATSADKVSLIGTVSEEGVERAVGLVQLFRSPVRHDRAEVGFLISDDYQGEGLGKSMSQLLFPLGLERGITTLEVIAQAGNRKLLYLLRSLRLNFYPRYSRGEMELTINLQSRANN